VEAAARVVRPAAASLEDALVGAAFAPSVETDSARQAPTAPAIVRAERM
jgi:hypothetical protein